MNKPKRGRGASFVVNDATNVRVYVRVRPFNTRERELGHASKCAVQVEGKQAFMMDTETGQPKDERFTFDDCFWSNNDVKSGNPFVGQEEVYNEVGSVIIDNAFRGYHSCLFAYGQTGSGKTFTMMGNREERKLWGMIPRLCNGFYERINTEQGTREFKVEVAYIEIYNEMLKDLLGTKNEYGEVKIKDHPIYGPSVDGNKLAECKHLDDIMNVMGKGDFRRTVAATNMNLTSSRSHAVFTIMFTQKAVEGGKTQTWFSKVNLIDLAGSERVEDSGVKGDNFKEAININKSLTTLGRVMDALVELSQGKKNIIPPYRESMLTRMLQDSLGGNSKTMMFANVSPSPVNYEETLSTLRYSSRARNIVNQAKVNSVSTGGSIELPPPPPSQKLEDLEKEERMLRDNISNTEGAISGARSEIEQLRSRLASLQSGNADLSSQGTRLSGDAQRMKEEKERSEAERNRVKEELEALRLKKEGDSRTNSTEISRLRAELEKARSERDAARRSTEAQRSDLENLLQELRTLLKQTAEQGDKMTLLERQIEDERYKARSYLQTLADMEDKVRRVSIHIPKHI